MGRLDDAAKRKVVELREAGLSFRKIKAVLELENIKVSAQAIYLFLKEFQAKPPSEQAGVGSAPVTTPGSAEGSAVAGRSGGWTNRPVWTMMREAPRGTGYGASVDSASHGGGTHVVTGNPPGPPAPGGSSGMDVQPGREVGEEEEEIQIVSVTSLARGGQQRGLQTSGMGVGLAAGASVRRRVALSASSSSTLVARKRLLDKALMHKARMRETVPQSGQQGVSLYRKDPSSLQSPEPRKLTMPPQAPSFSLNSPQPPLVRSRFGAQSAVGVARRMFPQRAGVAIRSVHPSLQRDPPSSCPGVRVANPVPSPPTSQGAGVGAVRPQQAVGQPPSTTLQMPPAEPTSWSGLQEQVQTLGMELRNLGLVVRVLVEQQGRLEREQAQQTQVQRQILSTLQGIASRLGPGRQPHSTRTPPPPPGPPTYSQSLFEPSPTSYAQCSPAQPKGCEPDGLGLDSLDTCKLSGLSPHGTNGFQALGGGDGFPTGHMSIHLQPQTPTYSHTYVETHTQATEDCLQGCGPSSNSGSPPSESPRCPQFNIIKVETL